MATDKETVEILLKTVFDKALRDFDKLNKQTDETKKKTKKLDQVIKNAKKNWVSLGIAVAGTAVAIRKGFDLSKTAASYNQSVQAMEKQFGVSSNKMMAKLREASGATIANKDLVLSANKAMALGVTMDSDKMASMMELARVKARAMGMTTTDAFNDIAVGVGRNSPMILDNLGIITKGWTEEAKAAGKAFDAQFILNKIQEDAAPVLKRLGELVETDAEKIQRMEASIDNASLAIGKALLPVMSAITGVLADVAQGFSTLTSGTQNLIIGVVAFGAAVIILTKIVAVFGVAFSTAFLPVTLITGAIVGLIWVFKNWEIAMQAVKVAFVWLGTEAVMMINRLVQPCVEMINMIINASNRLLGTHIENITSFTASTIENLQTTLAEEISILEQLQGARDSANEKQIQGNEIKNKKIGKSNAALDKKKQATLADYLSFFQSTLSKMQSIHTQYYTNQNMMLQGDYNKKIDVIDKLNMSDQQRAALKESVDAAYENKRSKLARKAAIQQKAISIMSIAVDTARGIMQAFATFPYPVAVAFSALIGGMGAIQAGLVAAQPIPEAAEGALIRGTASGSIIRAGENSRSEAIIPLENDEAMDKIGGMGGNITINFVSDTIIADDELPEKVIDQIDKGLYNLKQGGLSRSFA
ncbi:MAG: hypothetical protein GY853_02325 [PVC group bacterium]|nr:hypothetical protein [PVC group bacterium]